MRDLRLLLLFLVLVAASPGELAPYLIEDINTSSSSAPQRLMPVGESALFFARDGDGPGLWKSDGTAAGTAVVKRGLSGLGPWTASSSRAFFVITGAGGLAGLWTSDGTEAGTYPLTPAGLGSLDQVSAPVSVLGSRVFFSAQSPSFGKEPWVTDGTPNGTRMLADLRPGFGPSLPKQFTAFRGKVWFSALSRLYRSDGTSAGTVAFGPKLDRLEIWAIQGGRLWFMGELPTGARWREVWSTDGTPAGTQRVGQTRKIPRSPVSHGGRLWFLGDGTDLWSTDGTTAGTRKVSLPLLLPSPVRPELIASDGARLYVGVDYFLANEEEWVRGVWASDGSASGTRQVSGLALSETRALFNGRLYAVLYDGEGSRVLHRLDGTAAGTRPLRPDGEPDHVTSLVRFADLLIAFTSDGEIWQTDGTAEGTKLIREGLPHSEVVKAGPHLFFPAWEEETGLELWAMEE